jgi:hypothetical protein
MVGLEPSPSAYKSDALPFEPIYLVVRCHKPKYNTNFTDLKISNLTRP